jgi:hypothetical protein
MDMSPHQPLDLGACDDAGDRGEATARGHSGAGPHMAWLLQASQEAACGGNAPFARDSSATAGSEAVT